MPLKDGGGGNPQPYDEKTGRYTTFSNFAKPRNYDKEIADLKAKTKGMSLFSPERKEINRQLEQLEAEKEGFSSYDELKAYRLKQSEEKEKQRQLLRQKQQQEVKENKLIDKPVSEHQQKQFEIIQEFNPMRDDYHTGIRKASEIKTPQEAFSEESGYPDFTKEDMKKALEKGTVTIYSSKPISQGGFVSPSKMMAQDYAGSGKVYSMEVNINDVAWIDSAEGQYAKVKE